MPPANKSETNNPGAVVAEDNGVGGVVDLQSRENQQLSNIATQVNQMEQGNFNQATVESITPPANRAFPTLKGYVDEQIKGPEKSTEGLLSEKAKEGVYSDAYKTDNGIEWLIPLIDKLHIRRFVPKSWLNSTGTTKVADFKDPQAEFDSARGVSRPSSEPSVVPVAQVVAEQSKIPTLIKSAVVVGAPQGTNVRVLSTSKPLQVAGQLEIANPANISQLPTQPQVLISPDLQKRAA